MMDHTIQIKRGTRAQIEAAKAAGLLKDGEPYLITDEDRIAVGTAPNGYSSFAKLTDIIDEKVAVVPGGSPGYITGEDGVIRSDSSIVITKDINNSYVELAVGNVDFGTF